MSPIVRPETTANQPSIREKIGLSLVQKGEVVPTDSLVTLAQSGGHRLSSGSGGGR